MEAHTTRVVVWDVPVVVEPGAAFRVNVGVKCGAECSSAGRLVEIRDAEKQVVVSGCVGKVPWPGTTALYYAELELRAPSVEGLHALENADLSGDAMHGYAKSVSQKRRRTRSAVDFARDVELVAQRR